MTDLQFNENVSFVGFVLIKSDNFSEDLKIIIGIVGRLGFPVRPALYSQTS